MVNTCESSKEKEYELNRLKKLLYNIHDEVEEAIKRDNDYINALLKIKYMLQEEVY